MSWVDIEDAMHKAVVAASGLPKEQVFWSYQNVNAPPQDYVEIHFGSSIPSGIEWVVQDQDLNRPNGFEISQQFIGVREAHFDITCFTTDTLGENSARQMCENIRSRFKLPSIRSTIRGAGVSAFDSGIVQYVPDIPAAKFRGRATVTVRCYVPLLDCVEYVGYIARVTGFVYPSGLAHYTTGFSGFPFDTANYPGPQ